MTVIWTLLLTLLLPLIPWIGLASFWAARRWQPIAIWLIFVSGLILDLWWGKPMGETSLVLLTTAVVIWAAEKAWPASGRSFWPFGAALSLILTEIYLVVS